MIILTPAWSIDKKSKSIVYKKHIMSVFMIFSTSLIVTAVLVALSRMDVADVAERLVCIGQISSVCDSKTSTVS
jgi:hypothetical protein